MKSVAISIGDLNGIGVQLAIENHHAVSQIVNPIYCIDEQMLEQASRLLDLDMPRDFKSIKEVEKAFHIYPERVSGASGAYSFGSFSKAIEMARAGEVDAICTLPIHKKAWEMAGIEYKGHTDALRDIFGAEAIMMLGSPQMYVGLFTEHVPLKSVPDMIVEKDLLRFFIDFYNTAKPANTVAVLGLNPHAGDDGVLGDEEKIITEAIKKANIKIGGTYPAFSDPVVPDVAFTPNMRKRYTHYIAMYHDQGLAPLKALYFDEGINISLNLPILRTSVDHGTAFDIAYRGAKLNNQSYLNAIRYIADSTD